MTAAIVDARSPLPCIYNNVTSSFVCSYPAWLASSSARAARTLSPMPPEKKRLRHATMLVEGQERCRGRFTGWCHKWSFCCLVCLAMRAQRRQYADLKTLCCLSDVFSKKRLSVCMCIASWPSVIYSSINSDACPPGASRTVKSGTSASLSCTNRGSSTMASLATLSSSTARICRETLLMGMMWNAWSPTTLTSTRRHRLLKAIHCDHDHVS